MASPTAANLGTSLKTGALFGGGFSLAGKELHDCYEGEVSLQTGKRQGKGKYEYPNKAFSYRGEYLDGKKHGYGTFVIKGHSTYVGEFSHDEIEGSGRQVYENGSHYEGHFHLGERHGKGTFVDMVKRENYMGDFSHNARQGEGTLVLLDTETLYEGHFEKHKPCGEGKLTVPAAQCTYEGTFAEDLDQTEPGLGELKVSLNGYGKITRAEYTKEGQFSRNLLHGEGVYSSSETGITYKGQFSEDKPCAEPKRIACGFMQQVEEEVKDDAKEHKGKVEEPKRPQTAFYSFVADMREVHVDEFRKDVDIFGSSSYS